VSVNAINVDGFMAIIYVKSKAGQKTQQSALILMIDSA
jgi:hypothetical protein